MNWLLNDKLYKNKYHFFKFDFYIQCQDLSPFNAIYREFTLKGLTSWHCIFFYNVMIFLQKSLNFFNVI